MTRTSYSVRFIPMVLVLVGIVAGMPSLAHAADLTATQTVANVAQTKATRTITSGAVPAAPITLTIGTCVITLTSVVASDTDCANNTAAIATSTDTTTALIAARIRTITNLSDTGHGALTIGGSGSTASFTTTGTEAAATAITATLSAGTDFTLTTVNTLGVIPVAQTVTFTPADASISSYGITLNGASFSYVPNDFATIQAIVEGLVAALSGNSAATCSEDNIKVTCVAAAAGTSFTYSSTATGGGTTTGTHSGGGSHRSSGGSSSSSSSTSASVSTLLAQVAKLQEQLATMSGGSMTTVSFARDLDVGSLGADVQMLQVWLNAKGFMIASTGAGAKGSETTLFGGLTKAALAKFQASVGISPASGYFGPKTRAYISAHP